MPGDDDERVRVFLRLPRGLHGRAKALAARRGVTLERWYEQIVETEVERQESEQAEAERKRRGR